MHNTALLITNDGLGQGDEALRHSLATRYFATLLEGNFRPRALLFYGAGVKLACEGSPCLESLQALAEEKVEIVVCRSCLEHYSLMDATDSRWRGTMLQILEWQQLVDKVITL